MLAIPAVIAARVGSWPKLPASRLLRPIFYLLVVMAVASLAAGISGYFAAKAGAVLAAAAVRGCRVPPDKQVAFIADLWAHLAAYGFGFFGGIFVCMWVLLRRRKMT